MRLFASAAEDQAADNNKEEDDGDVTTRKARPFDFFQRAVTAEWEALSDAEREEYEVKALAWRERGPTREQRQA